MTSTEPPKISGTQLTKSIIKKWRNKSFDEQFKDMTSICETYSQMYSSFGIDDDVKESFIRLALDFYNPMEAPINLQMLWIQLLRILFRERGNDLECYSMAMRRLLCYSLLITEENRPVPIDTQLALEALKAISNFVFNSEKARITYRKHVGDNVLTRIGFLSQHITAWPVDEDMCREFGLSYMMAFTHENAMEMCYFDLRILFIVTGHVNEVRDEWVKNSEKLEIFIIALSKTVPVLRANEAIMMIYEITIQTLNILYNLYCHAENFDEGMAVRCAKQCAMIIGMERNSGKDAEVKQSAVNILGVLWNFLDKLCPKVEDTWMRYGSEIFEGHDMGFARNLLKVFEECLDKDMNESYYLVMYLKALTGLCAANKAARRYCRLKVLPPLKGADVTRMPDVGNTFRNKVVRLLKSTAHVKDAAEQFLFVLCKGSSGRMTKYCGFGYSAGLLANNGLLGNVSTNYLDSEDSETEEYNEVADKVNPITGCIPNEEHLKQARDFLASMSEEQKEYEVMRLVNDINKLERAGFIKPATVDETGRPRQVSHVAEMIKDVKIDEKQDSDSD